MGHSFAITSILLLLVASVHSWPHHQEYAVGYQNNLDVELDSKAKNQYDLTLSQSAEVIPRKPYEFVYNEVLLSNKRRLRSGLRDGTNRWPNNTVPYVIDSRFALPSTHLHQVRKAYTSQRDYLFINSTGNGCTSWVGCMGGRQALNLNVTAGCVSKGIILHELMHALGFHHEHVRADRDKYVRIVWENISPGHRGIFEKRREDEMNDFGVGYDYHSLMHYTLDGFSNSTFIPKEPSMILLKADKSVKTGNKHFFSNKDILKIGKMYGCSEDPRDYKYEKLYEYALLNN